MDDIAFDRLTRLFGASRSRREAARAVLGTFLGGALVGQTTDALADAGKRTGRSRKQNESRDRDTERIDGALADDAAGAGGRGIGSLGGGRPRDKRRGRNRGRGKNKNKGKGKGKGKDKNNDSCATAGQAPERGKPCCAGLVPDSAGRCAESAPNQDCAKRTCVELGLSCGTSADGCGGMLNCGDCTSGQVCCDGSCVTGVCCKNEECAPSGDTCTGNACLCGGSAHCEGDSATCCDPGLCVSTFTDRNNCGVCGNDCEGSRDCCESTCVDTQNDVRYCGDCKTACVIGEECIDGRCTCGSLPEPCERDQSCVEGSCGVCEEDDLCGGVCRECPAPPGTGPGIPRIGFCCDGSPGDPNAFCSCNGQCCKDCFLEGSPNNPTGEFCCSARGGTVCPNPDASDDPSQDACCIADADCRCFNQTGRFGSNRRPGR